MADVFTKAQRSHVMRSVRGRGNKSTEAAFAKALRAAGITGWRRHQQIRLTATAQHATTNGLRFYRSHPDFVFLTILPFCWMDVSGIAAVGTSTFHSTAPSFGKKMSCNTARDKHVTILFRQRVVVFVDGCFWHSCPLHGALPRRNSFFWQEKIDTNRSRDYDTKARRRYHRGRVFKRPRGGKLAELWTRLGRVLQATLASCSRCTAKSGSVVTRTLMLLTGCIRGRGNRVFAGGDSP